MSSSRRAVLTAMAASVLAGCSDPAGARNPANSGARSTGTGDGTPGPVPRTVTRAAAPVVTRAQVVARYGHLKPHTWGFEAPGVVRKLATKVNGSMGEDPNRGGSSRRWIITAVEHSLRRLQTDHIDVYQIHHPDPRTDVEETLSALTDLVRSGKVRAIGSSNAPASEIVEAHWVADRHGLQRLRTEQPTYSILNRGIEREVLPTCQRYGMGTLVWSPLAMGLLTGRYRKGQPEPRNARMNWVPRHLTDERKLDAVEQLIPLAAESGLSLTHLAIAFAITHPAVTSAIIGPRTMEQLEDLLAGAATVLDDEVLDRIDQIVAPGTDIGPLDVSYTPPALNRPALRRRSADERTAA